MGRSFRRRASLVYYAGMKLLLVLLLIAAVVTAPFLVLKRPWAVRFWHRIRLIVMIYVIVIVASAILRLVFNWGDIYG